MFIKKKDNERQIERKLQKAGKKLGFAKHQVVTAELVCERFRELMKQYHPDSTNLKFTMRVGVTLDDIRKAKDFILKHMEKPDA